MPKKNVLSTGKIALISLGALVLFSILFLWLSYNSLVSKELNVESKWSDVQVQYQRRVDLIPNLVESVKGYAQFEKSTLTEITQLRTQWTNARTIDEKINAGTQLDSAISRLLVTFENYPDLKTVETVNNLMVQLEGTENRISVARRDYNDAVRGYNTILRLFPTNIIANLFGFEKKTFFEAQEGSENAPKVNIKIQ
ncbi:MAG: LemA family protein [Candidatus Aenigmarchaeota archaeon]|nr:LemA family protein [Candidatus Aenigmarchaeota archaeon]